MATEEKTVLNQSRDGNRTEPELEPIYLAKRTERIRTVWQTEPEPNRTVRLAEQNRTGTLCSGFDSHLYNLRAGTVREMVTQLLRASRGFWLLSTWGFRRN